MALLRKQLSNNFKSSRTTQLHYSRHPNLPPGSITDFVWKDYCINIFRNIQDLGDVSYEDYMLSVCNHETLLELAFRGYCGRPFHVRNNNRFVIKTLRKSEAKILMDILPNYYNHIKEYDDSLLVKFYGLHASRPGTGGTKIYFVVVENLLQTDAQIHRMYDLKGSSKGRNPNKPGTDQPRIILKDSDFDMCFHLDSSTRSRLLEQIKIDCKFLADHGIMDYSLLLGVHIEPQQKGKDQETRLKESVKAFTHDDSKQEQNGRNPSTPETQVPIHRRDPTFSDFCPEGYRSGSRFGTNISAQAMPRNGKGSSSGGRKSRLLPEGSSVCLYMGIIDFLKNYTVIKRIEHAYKSLQYDPREISSVNPKHYATRFQEFLSKVFLSRDQLETQSSPRNS